MSHKSYCLIVNAFSNSGKAPKLIEKHRFEITKKLENVEICIIDKDESISAIASEKAKSFDVIVACGGDGTARNVAIGLKGSNKVFGLIPLGTGNDFAKMLNLPKGISKNLDVLKKASITSFDLVSFNDSYFINTLGLGFDGLTNQLATKTRLLKGSIKYIFAGVKALSSFKLFKVEIETKKEKLFFETSMVVIANGKWEGGNFLVSKNSDNNDGIIEVVVLKKTSRIRLLIEFLRLSFGKTLSNELFLSITTTELLIKTAEAVFLHADGEVEIPNQTFRIEVVPKKIRTIFEEF